MATTNVINVPASPNPDLATDPNLPTNLLYPSIRLFISGDMTGAKPHMPLQEHAFRIPNEPNTFRYELPHNLEQYEVAVFIKNLDSKPVSLRQRCLPDDGACPEPTVVPPNAEVEMPCRCLPHVVCDGFDILNTDTQEVLMRLRFDAQRIPRDDSVPAHHRRPKNHGKKIHWDPRPLDPSSRYDHSPHEAPARHDPTTPQPSRWWPWSRGTKKEIPPNTHCDVIDEHACPQAPDDADHAALLTHMRALLVAV